MFRFQAYILHIPIFVVFYWWLVKLYRNVKFYSKWNRKWRTLVPLLSQIIGETLCGCWRFSHTEWSEYPRYVHFKDVIQVAYKIDVFPSNIHNFRIKYIKYPKVLKQSFDIANKRLNVKTRFEKWRIVNQLIP